MTCPEDAAAALRCPLPVLVMVIKNMSKYMSFEVRVRCDDGVTRSLAIGNRVHEPRVSAHIASLPLKLDEGWNQIALDLAAIVSSAFKRKFVEIVSIKILSTCRVARVFFASHEVRRRPPTTSTPALYPNPSRPNEA